MKKPVVIGLGSCNLDFFGFVPKICKAEEKVNSSELRIFPGGVTANNITQVAKLNIRAGWFGKLGDDANGKILLNEFKKDKVDTSHIEIVKDSRSSFTWIQKDPYGNRAIIIFPGITEKISSNEIEEKHRDYIENSKILHCEASQFPLGPTLKAIEIAKNSNKKILFDLDISPRHLIKEARLGTQDQLNKILKNVDILALSKDAAREITKESNPERMILRLRKKYSAEIIAITTGKDGCILADKNKVIKVPAFKVKVVDTTGAGDSFHGALSYCILKDMTLEESGLFANACAALCCTKVGARSMPNLKEVKKLLKKGVLYE